jgi:hypothetical protein
MMIKKENKVYIVSKSFSYCINKIYNFEATRNKLMSAMVYELIIIITIDTW